MLQLGKDNNCKFAMSQVDCTTNGATKALKFQLYMGGEVISAQNNMITMYLSLE